MTAPRILLLAYPDRVELFSDSQITCKSIRIPAMPQTVASELKQEEYADSCLTPVWRELFLPGNRIHTVDTAPISPERLLAIQFDLHMARGLDQLSE